MLNLNEIKEAVRNIRDLAEKAHPKGLKSREYLETLLTLAQQVLSAKCPEEKEVKLEIDPETFEEVHPSGGDGIISYGNEQYNQALSDFRLYQAKCLGELEEVITNSSLSKALGDKYIKNHKGAEFGIFVWDKALSDLAQAIRDLFGGKE